MKGYDQYIKGYKKYIKGYDKRMKSYDQYIIWVVVLVLEGIHDLEVHIMNELLFDQIKLPAIRR